MHAHKHTQKRGSDKYVLASLQSVKIYQSINQPTNQLMTVLKKERKRERGSNLRRQRLASPTAQVLVAQTTQPVQKNRLRDELWSYVWTDTVDWGLGGGRKRGKKQAEEAARTNRRRTKRRMAAERTARRDKYRRWRKRRKYRRWRKRERARAGIEPTAAAPCQPDCPGVSRSDHSCVCFSIT